MPKAETIESLAARVEAAELRAAAAERRAEEAMAARPKIQKTKDRDQTFAEYYRRVVVDDTKEEERPFRQDDVVRLLPGPKFDAVRRYLEKQLVRSPGNEEVKVVLESMVAGTGPMGQVLKYKHNTKKHDMKYSVDFPGIGKDGVLASELALVQRAQ